MGRFCCSLCSTISPWYPCQRKGIGTGREAQHTRTVSQASKVDLERKFEQLYRESFELVYGYVRSNMPSNTDAEDIVAEAYLKAARSFASFNPKRAKFSTWVVTIARNCMVSHFRKERPTVAIDDIPESIASVKGEHDAVDDRDLANRLLAILDDEERQIVLMKYREDMRNVDIARELDMNASTVSTVLSRAMSKMRAKVSRVGC